MEEKTILIHQQITYYNFWEDVKQSLFQVDSKQYQVLTVVCKSFLAMVNIILQLKFHAMNSVDTSLRRSF